MSRVLLPEDDPRCEALEREPTKTVVGFLRSIGIEVRPAVLEGKTFVPGIAIGSGAMFVDPERLVHPGDLLHGAGHLAVLAPEEREAETPACDAAGELGAIAWSWAALVHLGLPPEVVFHAEGYRGGSRSIIENFSTGHTFGVPWLAYLGLTNERRRDEAPEAPVYPAMQRWLRV